MLVIKAKCPKCQREFGAAVRSRDDKIVMTPCCGWVSDQPPPKWAESCIATRKIIMTQMP